MLERVKNHILGYSAILAISTATVVSSAIYFLIIQNMERNITFITSQNVALQQQVTTLQSTISSIYQINDKRTSERVGEYKEIYKTKENLLKNRLDELKASFGTCKKSLEIVSSNNNKSCEGYMNFVGYMQSVKNQEVSVSNELSRLHQYLLKTKKEYNYRQAECDKVGRGSGNICEIASSQLGQISGIESEIETKRTYLNNLSEQLLKLTVNQ